MTVEHTRKQRQRELMRRLRMRNAELKRIVWDIWSSHVEYLRQWGTKRELRAFQKLRPPPLKTWLKQGACRP